MIYFIFDQIILAWLVLIYYLKLDNGCNHPIPTGKDITLLILAKLRDGKKL